MDITAKAGLVGRQAKCTRTGWSRGDTVINLKSLTPFEVSRSSFEQKPPGNCNARVRYTQKRSTRLR